MRESELRKWIEELTEEQAEKERQRSKRREQERQTLEKIRQQRSEQMRERFEEADVAPDLVSSLFELDEEFVGQEEEDIEARREELIEQGEDVDLPNETSAFLDGVTFQSAGSTARQPYYVEIRGHEGGLEHREHNPESINVRVNATRTGRRVDRKTVNWWFSFTPNRTKVWDFVIVVPYKGFYLMRSTNSLGGSAAILSLHEEYRVHQHNAGPRVTKSRLGKIRGNINEFTRYDRTLSGHYSHVLSQGETALLHVHQSFEVALEGSGAERSELNFSSASNNLPAPYFYAY